MRAPTLALLLTTLGILMLLALPTLAGDVEVQLPAGDGFVVKDNTGAIERLRIDEATGNVSRNGALFVHTTGPNSTFVGVNAGTSAIASYGNNSAFGADALRSNVYGELNAAFGFNALRSNNESSNSGFGAYALFANTTGSQNSAFGVYALQSNTTGGQNSAFGADSLIANTTGYRNTAVGAKALKYNITGINNSAVGTDALRSNTTGHYNSAFGSLALRNNTTGYLNTALGSLALRDNTTGNSNAAIGFRALYANTTGYRNTAVGPDALRANTTGRLNSAVGNFALLGNTTGDSNSALGNRALNNNTTGTKNVAVGAFAGFFQTSGSNNIYLVNEGVAAESGQIRIGTSGTHTDAFVAGIDGNIVAGSAVLVTAAGELGVAASSLRFKQEVRDMGAASDRLMRLRPVSFEYREPVDGAVDGRHYGLIAEEVAEVAPELVVYDDAGQPFSVRYHLLAPLLLNELQKERRTNREQQDAIERQQRAIEMLLARTEQLDTAGTPHGPGR